MRILHLQVAAGDETCGSCHGVEPRGEATGPGVVSGKASCSLFGAGLRHVGGGDYERLTGCLAAEEAAQKHDTLMAITTPVEAATP